MDINFNNKIILTLLMLCIAFLCVGVVSATDLSTVDINSADINSGNVVLLDDDGNDWDNNQIVSSNLGSSEDSVPDNSIKSVSNSDVGSFKDLSQYINDSLKNKSEIINLDKDYKYFEEDNCNFGIVVNFTNKLFIDGNGHTIDGSNLARVFKVLSSDVTIKNINFINTNGVKESDEAGYGGAIHWVGINGTLINCNFTNSTINGIWGGSIFWQGSNAYIKDCTFKNSTSKNFGGAIHFMDVTNNTVINCTFIDSKCYLGSARGGSICVFSPKNCNIINCTFINSSSSWGGSAIGLESSIAQEPNCYIKGCYFMDCSATSRGAIYSHNINCSVADCNFVNCFADYAGGAIYNDHGNLTVVNCNCTPLFGDLKAPIYNAGTILPNAVVTTLNGNDMDAAYWNVVNVTATVTVDDIPVAGGVISFNINNHTIEGVSDVNGIYSVLYEIDFTNTLPVNAIYLNVEGTQSLNAGNIRSKANSTCGNYRDLEKLISDAQSEGKTSIVLDKDYKYDINDKLSKGISFINNDFVIDGNGHTIDGSDLARVFNVKWDNITLKNINFINTKGNDLGGAIYWSGNNGSIINCNFTNSSTSDFEAQGGSIYWCGEYGSVIGCNFINSSLKSSDNFKAQGGSIYWTAGYGSVIGCNFINSSLKDSGEGGAICWGGTKGCISDCNFINSTINGNNSCGGAIQWRGTEGSVKNCTFTNSKVDYDAYELSNYGGSIAWYGVDGCISDCIFNNSTVSSFFGYGGSVYIFGRNCSLNNCNFDASHRSAVFWDGADGSMIACNISNSKLVSVGDIYWNGSNGCVKDCNLKDINDNSIYWKGINGSVINSNFTNCHSAILWIGTNGSVIACNFTDCSAYEDSNGGAIYWKGSGACVKDSIFNHSSAFGSGGAIYFDNVVNGIIINSSFFDSHCSGHGYYYYNKTGDNDLYLDQESKGGAISLFSVRNCSVIDCTFVDSISDFGGAIFVSGNDSSITGCNFINSYASDNGGAICFVSSYSNITDCRFIKSACGGIDTFLSEGAAIYCDNNGPYGSWNYIPVFNSSVTNCNFTNSKLRGNLTYPIFIESGSFNITNCLWDNFNVSVNVHNSTYGDLISGSFSRENGILIFIIDDKEFIANVSNYEFTIENSSKLNSKNYNNILVKYYLDGWNVADSSVNFTVSPKEVSINPLITGQYGHNLTGYNGYNKAGTLNVVIYGKVYNLSVDSEGNLVINGTDSLDVGKYDNVLVNYVSDDGNFVGTKLIDFKITRTDNYSVVIRDGYYGDNLTGFMNSTTNGTLIMVIDGVLYKGSVDLKGYFVLNDTDSLNIGNYTNISVHFDSYNSYINGSGIASFKIYPKDIPIGAVISNSVYGENLSGSIVGGVAGNVSVVIGGVVYTAVVGVDGQFVLGGTGSLSAGDYVDVPVKFVSDDGNFVGSDEASFIVSPKDISIDAVVGDYVYGENLSGSIVGGVAGNVSVVIGGVVYTAVVGVDGQFVLGGTGSLSAGDYVDVPVKFVSDDGNFAGSNMVNFTINKIGVIIDVTDVSGELNQDVVIHVNVTDVSGNLLDNITLNYNVSNSNMGGSVNVVDGVAEILLNFAKGGNYDVTVEFKGNEIYKGAISNCDVNIVKNVTEFTTVSSGTIYNGNYFKLTLKDVNGDVLANKTVKINLLGKIYNVTTDANGVAKVKIAATNSQIGKSLNVTYKFEGDEKYVATSGSTTIKIARTATMITKITKVAVKNHKNFYVKLTTKSGKVLSNKIITMKSSVSGKTYKIKTNSKGIAKIDLWITYTFGRNHKYTFKYAGNAYYKAFSITYKIKIVK